MARNLQPKTVECYLCHHQFEVGGRTQSTSCPGCYKPVMVADQIIEKPSYPARELKTCGKIIIKKKGQLRCHNVVAHGGIECLGMIDAKEVVSGDLVTLGPKSQFKGNLTAPALEMHEGAKVDNSLFAIGKADPPPESQDDSPDKPPPNPKTDPGGKKT